MIWTGDAWASAGMASRKNASSVRMAGNLRDEIPLPVAIAAVPLHHSEEEAQEERRRRAVSRRAARARGRVAPRPSRIVRAGSFETERPSRSGRAGGI